MSNVFTVSRGIGSAINEGINKRQILSFGIVKKSHRKAKMVDVLLLPHSGDEQDIITIPYFFSQAAKDVQSGGMPPIGARVFVFTKDTGSERPADNMFAFGGMFDANPNTAPVGESDGNNDVYYYMIMPPNGGSIHFYDADGTHKVKIKATNDFTVEVADQTEIICNDIKMGNINNVKKVVLEDHLSKFNGLIDYISSVFAPLSAVTDPISATAALIALNVAWQAGSNAQKDTTNISSQTKIS